MSGRIEPIRRRRGPAALPAVSPLRDDDDQAERERRRRQPPPPQRGSEPAPQAVTRDADGHPHVDLRA